MLLKTAQIIWQDSRVGSQDASFLGIRPGEVYPELIVTDYLGSRTTFQLRRVVKDMEGDIRLWEYRPIANTAVLTIFNS